MRANYSNTNYHDIYHLAKREEWSNFRPEEKCVSIYYNIICICVVYKKNSGKNNSKVI